MMFRLILTLFLFLFSQQVFAIACADIWTQGQRGNSAVPAVIPFPASTNPVLPQPMQPVDYYYNSSITLLNGAVRSTTGATTRLFVNGNLTIENNVRLNAGGAPQNLIIVVSGNIIIYNNATINGFILAGGVVQLYNNAEVNGAITAKGALSNFSANVSYRADAIPLLQGGILCEQAQSPLPAARAHYPLDFCTTQTSSVITDLTGNYPATAINVGAVAVGQVLEAGDFSAAGGDYINVPSGALTGLTNFSLSMWFRLDAHNDFKQLFSASNAETSTELEFYINAANEVRAGIKDSYVDFTGGSSSAIVANGSWTQATLTRSSNQLCLYLNEQQVNCKTVSAASLNVSRAAVGTWWQRNGAFDDDFRGDIDEVLLFAQALSPAQISQLYQNQLAGNSFNGTVRTSSCPQCLTDDFSGSLSADNWVTSRSSGSFTPQVVNGRLRMTEASGNQATSATYQRLYPAADNLVIVEFDYRAYGGNGADGLAVVLSDATVTPQAGAFGGPLGYGFKPGIPGFAGGWLGFGLDEYGNFSNEGGSSNVGRRQQAVVVRGSGSGTSGYNYLRGTCNNGSSNTNTACLTPAVDGNQNTPHRYRITVDSRSAGSTLVSVERNAGSGFVSLIAPFNAQNQPNQAPVPENFFLSLTGSTGGSTNIHELDNLSICALRSSPVGEQIDHFEFDYSGQALTCKPETFTIRACKNAACSELVTQQVAATLSPANSANVNWAGGNVITFSGGSTTASLARTVSGSSTVGVSGSVPSTRPLSQTLCRAGAGPLNTASCSVNFADSGLVFEVPDGIANQPNSDILLSAVRKDDNSQQCVPGFANVTRNVAFWSDYITPDSSLKPVAWPVTVNNQSAGLTAAAPVIMPLAFNAQGQASLSVNYADAGQLQLNARYSGSVANGDAGLEMAGADQFIRRPLGLCIQTGGECAAGDVSCPVFARAGETFNLTISAHAYAAGSSELCQNPLTPSFRQNLLPLSHSLVTPVSGAAGVLSNATYNHQMATNGQNTVVQSISEVGVFRFHSAAFNYLGMADAVPAASSGPTGRFIPARFSISPGAVMPACGTFSYFGQADFSTNANISALNSAGNVTQNYTASFARLNLNQWTDSNSSSGMRFSVPMLPVGSDLLQGVLAPLGSWQNGEAAISASHYASRPDNQVAPVNITVYAQPVDADGVTVSMAQPLHSATTVLRFGRLFLHSAAGPEEEAMPLRLNAEYYDGSRFVQNLADNCTVLSATPALLSTIVGSPALTLQGSGGVVGQGALPAGPLQLAPSGQSGNWIIEYQVPEYLRYNWRDGVTDFSQSPQADIMFGRFRGNPRQIFWRERFQ
ncbi:DUF6701 domain-containing protein [Rheinheimera sp.]|uniref:DUF6701 domain-containing protein n=1 Tax=Rheinheimera sp. TaxID=1869214 RepID=UPI0040474A2E